MSNRLGVLTVSYNQNEMLEANIRQFKNFNVMHVLVISDEPWHGESKWQKKIPGNMNINNSLVMGSFGSDAEQRNAGMEYLQRHAIEWTLVVDTDEFWEKKEIIKLQRELEKNKNFVDVIKAPNMHVYWKNMNERIYPDPQPDNPIVAIRTNQRFEWSRLAPKIQRSMQTKAEFHHLSYVRSDKEMEEKMSVSEHSHELIPGWYDKVWLPWEEGNTNLHPVIPHQFAYTKYEPVPKEIKELF